MKRPVWKGAINFGLVHVPVRLWRATSPNDIRFRELHRKDHVPLKQKRVCPAENKEVPYDQVVKGLEVEKDHFIVIEPEELEALQPENAHSIDIEHFVDLVEVDPVYFETAYYVAPEQNAARAYSLLLAAMRESGKAAVARMVMRAKQHLVLLRDMGHHAIGMSTLYYADEVLDLNEITGLPKETKPSKQELQMAIRLIEGMSVPFDPEQYEDLFRDKVLELAKKKSKGKSIDLPKPKRETAQIIDLVSALQASLDDGDERKPAAPKKTAARRGATKSQTPSRTRAKAAAKPAAKRKRAA
jgi:DNA end-binding protein Ku